MQFLYPIGFLALAGLIIPVLLHLWSVKQGKTLKIGSIAFLGESATTSSKSLKLTDLLLFILRCLLIILVAFLLAQPYFNRLTKTTSKKGWVLMDKSKITSAYHTNKAKIDSLITAGFELHDFNVGFKEISLNDSIFQDNVSSRLNYLSLLNQLNKEIPTGYAAYLFADKRLINFDGNLPQLNFTLTWGDVAANDTVKNWSTTFLGKTYQAKSTASLTSYNADRLNNLSAIKVMIFDSKGTDSKYINAALRAISDFTKRKIEQINSSNNADVVFWLSDQPLTKAALKANVRVISYQHGKSQNVNSTLKIAAETSESVALKKRIAFDHLKGVAFWVDGFGDPILLKERNHFHFYSRFNPLWTDLVWDEQFVKALIPIVLGEQNAADFGFEDHDADQRLLAKTQFEDTENNKSSFSPIQTTKSADKMIWILAFLVLIVERLLSFRHKNIGYAKG